MTFNIFWKWHNSSICRNGTLFAMLCKVDNFQQFDKIISFYQWRHEFEHNSLCESWKVLIKPVGLGPHIFLHGSDHREPFSDSSLWMLRSVILSAIIPGWHSLYFALEDSSSEKLHSCRLFHIHCRETLSWLIIHIVGCWFLNDFYYFLLNFMGAAILASSPLELNNISYCCFRSFCLWCALHSDRFYSSQSKSLNCANN